MTLQKLYEDMENKRVQPTNAEIKADLLLNNTKFAIDMFEQGYLHSYNYGLIQNLNVEINILYNDLNRLVWYIRGRHIYGLPIDQINKVRLIKNLIEQKQSQKSDAKNTMWISGIFVALAIGGMILGDLNNNKQK